MNIWTIRTDLAARHDTMQWQKITLAAAEEE